MARHNCEGLNLQRGITETGNRRGTESANPNVVDQRQITTQSCGNAGDEMSDAEAAAQIQVQSGSPPIDWMGDDPQWKSDASCS